MTEEKKIFWLERPDDFPPTSEALSQPNGLLAASAEINAEWLLSSYVQGIFPWYSEGEPVLWWSPTPRAVLYLERFKLHRSLRKAIKSNSKNPKRQVTLNHAFERVMRQCAAPREDGHGTWITEDVIAAYVELHNRGVAHSVEHWEEGELIGGLYCVALGKMIFGESMFARRTDASKIAFAHFVSWLKRADVRIIDCQQSTRHLTSLGAEVVERTTFEDEVATQTKRGNLDWRPVVLDWIDDST